MLIALIFIREWKIKKYFWKGEQWITNKKFFSYRKAKIKK